MREFDSPNRILVKGNENKPPSALHGDMVNINKCIVYFLYVNVNKLGIRYDTVRLRIFILTTYILLNLIINSTYNGMSCSRCASDNTDTCMFIREKNSDRFDSSYAYLHMCV